VVYVFARDSLFSPLVDNDIPTLPSRPSPALEICNEVPDNATSKASESSPSGGSLASLAGPGLARGSGRLASGRLASGSNLPPRN